MSRIILHTTPAPRAGRCPTAGRTGVARAPPVSGEVVHLVPERAALARGAVLDEARAGHDVTAVGGRARRRWYVGGAAVLAARAGAPQGRPTRRSVTPHREPQLAGHL